MPAELHAPSRTVESVLGFVLQPTYRIETGRAVVEVYGVLQDGRSFLIRDGRDAPHFWIRESDLGKATKLDLQTTVEREPRRTFSGEPTVRVDVPIPSDVPALRERLHAVGIASFEADVRYAYRYLLERGIRSTLRIEGPARRGHGVDAVFVKPNVTPADWTPELRWLSLDIETDPQARQILSIALSGCGADEVLLFAPEPVDVPPRATAYATERELLLAYCRRVRELDPDVLTGWSVIDFDLTVLNSAAERLGIRLEMGRGSGPVRVRRGTDTRGASTAYVPGRVVLDGIQLLRGAFIKFPSYSLQNVSTAVLGEGKTIQGSDRGLAILRAWKEDLPHFVEYNLKDAQLVLRILDRLNLQQLTVERSRLTGMPPDRVGASIATFDFLYLAELSRRKIVAPTLDADAAPLSGGTGGHVLDPVVGLHRNVWIFDFKSLYPSLIRTFQIDPLGLRRAGNDRAPLDPTEWIEAPGGALFRRQPGILPGMLDELFPKREAAKLRGDGVASQAIKILMNSFYGVLGTSACRFAAPDLANSITGFGREILLWARDRMESMGFRVLYGDTDSLFVASGETDPVLARDHGVELVRAIDEQLSRYIRERWNVESRLELEFERLYLRLLLPAARHSTAGARKRYAGLVKEADGERVIFTGMEVVRRDWTELAKRIQRELFERLFHDRAVEDYLREAVRELREGRHDSELVYRKALRKSLDEYTASTPPHVAAARRMSGSPGRLIHYVMTRDGAHPAAELEAPIDYEHYVQKQIRGVAEPVLTLLGLEFDRVVGDDSQLTLF